MRHLTIDNPNVRARAECLFCEGPKEAGLVVCWPCYRTLGMRYGNAVAEHAIAEAEERLEQGRRVVTGS